MRETLAVSHPAGLAILASALLAACATQQRGAGAGEPMAPTDYLITIEAFRFSPQNLEVPPGTTVTVRNNDPVPHSVTSQTVRGRDEPGGVDGISFDTGVFEAGARTFTIPADALPGTVIPYYCAAHDENLASRGQVTVIPAQ